MNQEIIDFLIRKEVIAEGESAMVIGFTDGTEIVLNVLIKEFTEQKNANIRKNVFTIIEEMQEKNPYPEDIFTKPTEDDKKRIHPVLSEAGISCDRMFADFGRNVYNNALKGLTEQIEDEF